MDARIVARTLRTRLPETVVDALKSAALHTGSATARARMLPSVIVVGAQRSGTTTLFRLLAEHPHLERPTLWKGTGYFDDDYERGPDWYRAHFPVRSLSERGRARPVVAFECSGYYLFHPLAPARIAADLPGVHVVVMLRDPVERAWSAYRHEKARGFETLTFGEAVATEGVRTHGEAARLAAEPGYRSFSHRHHAYLQRGEYALQISRYVDLLGPERVHLIDAHRFFERPVQEFAALQEALGVPVWLPPRVDTWNASSGPPLDDADRQWLMAHFEPHDDALAGLLGAVPSWRTRTSA